jgi:hypothetical protein
VTESNAEGAVMTILLGLILVGIGVVEYTKCESILRFFDSNVEGFNSPARQNVLITSAIFIIAGLACIVLIR